MRRWMIFSLLAALPAACSSAFTTATGTEGTGGMAQGSTTSGKGGSGTSTSSSSGGTGGKGTASSSASSAASSSTGTVSGCPNEAGAYSITTDGLGCATEGINLSTIVCIQQSGCNLTIMDGSSGPGVDGTPTIGPLGNFPGTDIKQGDQQRQGCIGIWDNTKRELKIVCGSTGTTCDATNAQCCAVTLSPHQGGC